MNGDVASSSEVLKSLAVPCGFFFTRWKILSTELSLFIENVLTDGSWNTLRSLRIPFQPYADHRLQRGSYGEAWLMLLMNGDLKMSASLLLIKDIRNEKCVFSGAAHCVCSLLSLR